jgi:hypothetical protein
VHTDKRERKTEWKRLGKGSDAELGWCAEVCQQLRTCAAPEVVDQPVILTHVGADASEEAAL